MNRSLCATCLNLDYSLYNPVDTKFYEDYSRKEDSSVRFISVEFVSLTAAAIRGCLYCDVLTRGCALFWPVASYVYSGDESNTSDSETERYALLLQISPGAGLRAIRHRRGHLPWGEILPKVEFFTKPSRCRKFWLISAECRRLTLSARL
jgi:hypothetical protein